MRILAWYLPLAALREMPVVALIAAGQERALLRVNALTALSNIVLVVATVPKFGLVGAAAATAATEVIRLWLAARAAGRAGYPTIDVRQLWPAAAAAVAMTALILLVRPESLWTSIPLGALGYGATLLLLMRRHLFPRQANRAT